MEAAQRMRRLPARSTDRPLYQWATAAALLVTLAYAGLAVATLRDTVDGAPVSAIDAAWPFWLGTAALALLAGALAQIVIQMARPRIASRTPADALPLVEDQRRGNLAWVLPAVTAVASVLLVRLYHTPLAAVIGGAALFVATLATVVTHYHLRDERAMPRSLAGIGLAFLTHASAFYLLTMIYSNKWRSMYSATAIALATMLMLLQMTDGEEIAWLRRLLYALIGGLLIGQATWALNYWAATGWTGGAMLLVFFYLIAGLTTQQNRGNLTRRVLVEYLVVTGLAFAIITASVTLAR
jgi:Protein of unknown function (DUF5656)